MHARHDEGCYGNIAFVTFSFFQRTLKGHHSLVNTAGGAGFEAGHFVKEKTGWTAVK